MPRPKNLCVQGAVLTDRIKPKNEDCVSVESTLKVDGDVCVEDAVVTDCIKPKTYGEYATVTVKNADLCVDNTLLVDCIEPKPSSDAVYLQGMRMVAAARVSYDFSDSPMATLLSGCFVKTVSVNAGEDPSCPLFTIELNESPVSPARRFIQATMSRVTNKADRLVYARFESCAEIANLQNCIELQTTIASPSVPSEFDIVVFECKIDELLI